MLIQPWIKVMYCSLLWLTLHIRAGINISHLSIPGIVAHGRCYISHCFVLCVFFNCLSCSACILQMRNKPNQFLIQIKVYFFHNLWFCPSFKYYSYNYYFYYYLLLIYMYIYIYIYIICMYIFFSACFFCYYLSFSLLSNAKISLILFLPLSSLSIF